MGLRSRKIEEMPAIDCAIPEDIHPVRSVEQINLMKEMPLKRRSEVNKGFRAKDLLHHFLPRISKVNGGERYIDMPTSDIERGKSLSGGLSYNGCHTSFHNKAINNYPPIDDVII